MQAHKLSGMEKGQEQLVAMVVMPGCKGTFGSMVMDTISFLTRKRESARAQSVRRPTYRLAATAVAMSLAQLSPCTCWSHWK